MKQQDYKELELQNQELKARNDILIKDNQRLNESYDKIWDDREKYAIRNSNLEIWLIGISIIALVFFCISIVTAINNTHFKGLSEKQAKEITLLELDNRSDSVKILMLEETVSELNYLLDESNNTINNLATNFFRYDYLNESFYLSYIIRFENDSTLWYSSEVNGFFRENNNFVERVNLSDFEIRSLKPYCNDGVSIIK